MVFCALHLTERESPNNQNIVPQSIGRVDGLMVYLTSFTALSRGAGFAGLNLLHRGEETPSNAPV